jgi:hypothetical protein
MGLMIWQRTVNGSSPAPSSVISTDRILLFDLGPDDGWFSVAREYTFDVSTCSRDGRWDFDFKERTYMCLNTSSEEPKKLVYTRQPDDYTLKCFENILQG